jgi:hypothetical protein
VESFSERMQGDDIVARLSPAILPAISKQGGGRNGRPESPGPHRPAEKRAGFSSVKLADSPSALAFLRKGTHY